MLDAQHQPLVAGSCIMVRGVRQRDYLPGYKQMFGK